MHYNILRETFIQWQRMTSTRNKLRQLFCFVIKSFEHKYEAENDIIKNTFNLMLRCFNNWTIYAKYNIQKNEYLEHKYIALEFNRIRLLVHFLRRWKLIKGRREMLHHIKMKWTRQMTLNVFRSWKYIATNKQELLLEFRLYFDRFFLYIF